MEGGQKRGYMQVATEPAKTNKKENEATHEEKTVKTRRDACIHASHTHASIHAYIRLVQERER